MRLRHLDATIRVYPLNLDQGARRAPPLSLLAPSDLAFCPSELSLLAYP